MKLTKNSIMDKLITWIFSGTFSSINFFGDLGEMIAKIFRK